MRKDWSVQTPQGFHRYYWLFLDRWDASKERASRLTYADACITANLYEIRHLGKSARIVKMS